MGFLDKIKSIFTGGSQSKLIDIEVEHDKCGNQMKLLFRKGYDIQKVYEDNRDAAYEVNKIVVCDKCYKKMKLQLEFDKKYNLIEKSLENLDLVTKKNNGSKNMDADLDFDIKKIIKERELKNNGNKNKDNNQKNQNEDLENKK
jgi:hypothetical protein